MYGCEIFGARCGPEYSADSLDRDSKKELVMEQLGWPDNLCGTNFDTSSIQDFLLEPQPARYCTVGARPRA